MIDLQNEKILSLAEAAKVVPPARNGKKCHISTILRWITKGTRTPSGVVIHLEGQRLGNRWLTSAEAIARYMAALTPPTAPQDTPPAPTPRTPGQRQRAAERAGRELDGLGI